MWSSRLCLDDGRVTRGELRLPSAVPTGRPRRARWLVALAGLGGLLFTIGLLVRVRCVAGGGGPAPGGGPPFGFPGVGVVSPGFSRGGFLWAAPPAGRGGGGGAGGAGRGG